MTIWRILVWIWENVVPTVWSRILKVPRERWSLLGGRDRNAFERRVTNWLIAWRCISVVSAVLALTASPPGRGLSNSGPIRYAAIGLLFTGCTLALYLCWSLRDYLAPWRTAFGGAAFISAPYFYPAIAWRKPFKFLPHFGMDPWAGDRWHVNGLVCIACVTLNVLVCLSFWWFARKQVS
jgi:hypothetical protein